MKLFAFALAVLCTACTSNRPQLETMIGVRDFADREAWESTDQQEAIGLQMNWAGKNGFGPEVGFTVSSAISRDGRYENRPVHFTESVVYEVNMGARKNFMLNDNWQFMLSGGVAATMLTTSADLTYAKTYRNSNMVMTPYAQTGLNYLFNDNLSVGVLYRRTFLSAEADIWVNDPPTDSNTFMLTLGYGF